MLSEDSLRRLRDAPRCAEMRRDAPRDDEIRRPDIRGTPCFCRLAEREGVWPGEGAEHASQAAALSSLRQRWGVPLLF